MRELEPRELVTGSGENDIGGHVGVTLTPLEVASHKAEALHRAAEERARQQRIDQDKIVRAALDTLEALAHDKCGLGSGPYSYIAGVADITMDAFRTYLDRATYVRDRLADIRQSLSPLAR